MIFFDDTDLTAILTAMGETVTIAGQPVSAIYDGPFQRVDVSGAGVESFDPRITLQSTQVSALGIIHGTAVITPDGTMVVVGIEPERQDGQGLTTLILSEDTI